MNEQRIAKELVAMAKKLAKDPSEEAHSLIMKHGNLIKMIRDVVDDVEDEFRRAERSEMGLQRAGGGMTEAQTFLKFPLKDMKRLQSIVNSAVDTLERYSR